LLLLLFAAGGTERVYDVCDIIKEKTVDSRGKGCSSLSIFTTFQSL